MLAQPLGNLINASATLGIYPTALKLATITPVLKKGDPTDTKNYRPISVLSVFSKIIEKVVGNQIINFLHQYNILCPAQHSFRKNKSTETATLEYIQLLCSDDIF